MALTERRRLFALEYCANGGNAAQAARDAGFAEDSAAQEGYRLLRDPEVRAFVDARLADRLARLDVTTDRVLGELVRVATSSVRSFIDENGAPLDVKDIPLDAWASVSSVEFTRDALEEALERGERLCDDGLERPENQQARKITKMRFWPKTPALELLGKHLGLFEAKDGDPAKDVDKMPREERVRRAAELIEEAKLRVLSGGRVE